MSSKQASSNIVLADSGVTSVERLQKLGNYYSTVSYGEDKLNVRLPHSSDDEF